jgi:hypothetical protein
MNASGWCWVVLGGAWVVPTAVEPLKTLENAATRPSMVVVESWREQASKIAGARLRLLEVRRLLAMELIRKYCT